LALVAKQFRTAKGLKLEYANFIFAFYIMTKSDEILSLVLQQQNLKFLTK
jgi:hypothetical protein